jgi:Spy/CpxP family protein refolding chaperone
LLFSNVSFLAIGCDNPLLDNAVDLDSQELQDFSSELASDLGLSKSSTKSLNDVLNRHGRGGKHREPGFLWKIAGELAVTLTDEEKARLFEKMDEKDIPLFGGSKGKKGHAGKGRKGGDDFGGIYKVLTDDQKVTFKAIVTAYKERFKAIHEQVKDGSLSKEDARSQMDALKEAMQAEVDALLTEEQKAQIDQNKADRETERQAYKDSSKAVMVDVLDMTAEQVTAFGEANKEARDAAMALFEQAQNGDIDKDTLREGLKNIFATKNEKMEALFNDDQLEIIKIHKALELRMKKHRGQKGKKGGGRKGRKGNGGNRGNNK